MGEAVSRAASRKRATFGALVAAVSLFGLTAAAGAQTTDPAPTTNFSLAGAKSPSGTALSIDTNVSGTMGFCNNVNGLGAELYFQGGNGSTLTVRHATVSPFVVPLHIGLMNINSTDPANALNEDFITIGVTQGTPVQFGSTGPSEATYGGIFAGKSGAGLVSWNYSADITCNDSLVMPILSPLLAPSGSTTTTAVPDTTVAPTTTDTTTTAPPAP
ncbi:MAG: hypothetical protein ACKOYM_10180 [Actinomycetes bacterium]